MIFLPPAIQNVVPSSKSYLDKDRYIWSHNSVLLFLTDKFFSLQQCIVYTDLHFFLFPCLITNDSFLPDLILLTENKILYIIALITGFQTNIQINSTREAAKFSLMISNIPSSCSKVMFINLSINAIVVMDPSCISEYLCFMS